MVYYSVNHYFEDMATVYQISRKKAEAISSGVFLISLGILFYLNAWWPGILLAIWAFLATRQSLTGRHFDMIVTTFILVGLFSVITFNISWATLGPLLFIVGGGYVIFREYFYVREGDELAQNRVIIKKGDKIVEKNVETVVKEEE